MQVLAILSNKGGVGKSSLAINLSVEASLRGKQVALVDVDPQASTASWGDSRSAELPAVVSAQASRLEKILDSIRTQADLVIIDTAPHSDRDALMAAKLADFILIPCRPAILDLRAVGNTIDLLTVARVHDKAAIVLNAVPNKSMAIDAIAALRSFNLPIAPVTIYQRVAFMHSLVAGLAVQEYESDGKAAHEIRQLYKWMIQQLKM